MLSDDVPSEEWDRFRLYASQVRSLVMFGLPRRRPKRRITPATWAFIALLNSGTPLLPNLRHLGFRWDSPESTEIIHIIPRSIQHLSVFPSIDNTASEQLPAESQHEWEASFRMLLSMVFKKAPQLESFVFAIGGLRAGSVLSPLTKLEVLCTVVLLRNEADIETFRILSTLPALRSVAFETIAIPGSSEASFSGFHSLRSLVINDHPNSVYFYDFFSSPQLTELEIEIYPATLSFPFSCDTWARQFPALQRIRCAVQEQEILPRNQRKHPISRVIKPLFAIPTIAHVSLTFPETQYSVLDADVLNIAAAWPHLQELKLHSMHSRLGSPFANTQATPSFPGLDSLLTLALHCPLLHTLHLPGLVIPESLLTQIDQLPILDHQLRSVWFRFLAGDEIAACAVAIDRLFPHLSIPSIVVRRSLAQDVKELWSTIWSCQMARHQQAQRARQATPPAWRIVTQ